MKPFTAVLMRELLILKRRMFKQLLSYTVSPLLFMIAFGWGIRGDFLVDELPYIAFIVPGLIAMNSMRQSFSLSTEINISRFYWKTFDEIQSSPITDFSYTMGEAVSGVIKGWVATAVILVLALLFGVPVSVNLLLAISITLNTFIFASIGIITAMVVKTHAAQGMLTNFVITPMAFLCGTFFPLDSYPDWVRVLILALPLIHSTRTIRAAALDGAFPLNSLLYLAVFALGSLTVAVRIIRKAKD
jgi:ABC-type polysaccharide/polyol phosphate export permease